MVTLEKGSSVYATGLTPSPRRIRDLLRPSCGAQTATDRLLATLGSLRLAVPHAALAELYDVDRSTVSSAVREARALLAARGFAIPDAQGCASAPWKTSSPMPRPRTSRCEEARRGRLRR